MIRRATAWHVATVADTRRETASARRIELEVPTWPGNEAGAHVDVRLTAPDGYQATRSYSLASSGEGTRVTLAVDEVPTGEVSPFLVHDLRVGDRIEVHGPLGAFFIWTPAAPAAVSRPTQLIAGGSGVVPLFAMAEAHATAGDPSPLRLLVSVRTPEDLFFRRELAALTTADPQFRLDLVYTRAAPAEWPVPAGRLTAERVRDVVADASLRPRVYVCGPTPFVEAMSQWLVADGHAAEAIRTERFGGSR